MATRTTVTMTYVFDGIPPAHDHDLIRAIKDMLATGATRETLDSWAFDIKRERKGV